MIDPLLLCVTKVATFMGDQPLTNASGFFFSRDRKLFLITSLHVLRDDASKHFPDRVLIDFHTDLDNLTQTISLSMPLYRDGKSVWLQATDGMGAVDIAAVEIDSDALTQDVTYQSFNVHQLLGTRDMDIGTALLIVGFPLGFHDTLHHLPVARHAIVASCFDLRFQGQGYFLTDARTHRGMSGAPVVVRPRSTDALEGETKWMLAGVHSARLDVGTRDLELDEQLGLNCAWFSDILPTLTETKLRSPAH